MREELLKLGEACYSQRPILRDHLARACLRGLKRHPFRIAMIDGFDRTSLSNGKLLGAAMALSRHLRKTCPERRIGIVLPPGKGGVLAATAFKPRGPSNNTATYKKLLTLKPEVRDMIEGFLDEALHFGS